MPALWSGSITFGLVSIPVRLQSSQSSKSIGFNLLHKECLQRIKQAQYCPTCEKYVDRQDLVSGYEYEPDHYVVMEPEDFKQAEGEASRNIDIVAFVDRRDIEPAHLNKTYYLEPAEGAEKGYLLLFKGMQETDKVAICRFVMRGKEYIGAVGSTDKGLLLHVLFHEGEFKRMEDIVEIPQVEVKEKELTLAKQIIENLSEEFAEDMLADKYRERLFEVIRQKSEGREVTVAQKAHPAEVIDLMDALKRSLKATEKKPAAKAGAEATADKERRQKRKRA